MKIQIYLFHLSATNSIKHSAFQAFITWLQEEEWLGINQNMIQMNIKVNIT